ncbi:CPBP family intramembrane metalloprotease [Spirulina sp. CS-785/01]|uniref:CPBP family intramembrane glutamic endopeptidase n=1 Tax=Spirulina sp. CS-785/01 TaxID=3021716 RepID=UPI00233065DB|nr:CPBP family intramembrane glutamic endopeptidase [Spirulina sp. CS-785/01]MDB9313320.1 CPBP family intramembrane metalloprotease [Spirulina sp. CS-785/01]
MVFSSMIFELLEGVTTAQSWLKVVTFFCAWGLIWLPIAVGVSLAIRWHPGQPLTSEKKFPLLASLYLIVPLIVWGTMGVEGTSLADYGLSWNFSLLLSLVGGLGMAIFGLLLVFGLESGIGWVEWQWENVGKLRSQVLPILTLGLLIGLIEELIFRGILYNIFQSDLGLTLAAILSSLIFALTHLLWDQQDTLPQFPGLWLMGMILVLARLVDNGQLGLAWGLHAGWVWGLTCLDTAELITYTPQASPWFIGFNQNPLAGIAGISCLLLTGVLLVTLGGL